MTNCQQCPHGKSNLARSRRGSLLSKTRHIASAMLTVLGLGATATVARADGMEYTMPEYVYGTVESGIACWTTSSVPETCSTVASSSDAVTWGESGETSWYVVTGTDVRIDAGVVCNGDVNLVLCKGAKLTVESGLVTDEYGSFSVYGQPDGFGELVVVGSDGGAGIGGGEGLAGSSITINGGRVTATGGSGGAGIGGGRGGYGQGIAINGGEVIAFGTDGAGIGGGYGGEGADITINGGTVTAVGGDSGAGIGGCAMSACSITVNGGEVTATGGSLAAGIGGGGDDGDGTSIAIHGGTVIATGGSNGAGIGGGEGGGGSSIEICGGTVTASGGSAGANAIGSGEGGCEPLDVRADADMRITAGPDEPPGTVIEHESDTDLAMVCEFLARHVAMEYVEPVDCVAPVYVGGEASGGIECWATNRVPNSYKTVEGSLDAVTWGDPGEEGWYVVRGRDVRLGAGVVCRGHVNLVLCEGSGLTVASGLVIDGDGSFTVYGQPNGSGELTVTGGDGGAGIGGGDGRVGSHITVNGGRIVANGGDGGAGIGGGRGGAGSDITVNGGEVTANGGNGGAGIGGGRRGQGADIRVNGGEVTANSGSPDADNIGNGVDCPTPASNIYVISDLTVLAGVALPLTAAIEHASDTDLATVDGFRSRASCKTSPIFQFWPTIWVWQGKIRVFSRLVV